MHVPAPSSVTTAAVAEPPVVVVSPAIEHTAGVVVENATTKPEFAVAVMPNAALPNVLVVNALNVIDWAVLLMVSELDVTEESPVAEKVIVYAPPAPVIFMPLNVATPDDVFAVVPASEPADGPLAFDAVTVVTGCPVITFPEASTTRTTGCVAKFVPTPTPPTG